MELTKKQLAAQRYSRKLKQDILNKYGNMCECCGVSTFEFLTVEHKNGDGAEERLRLVNGKRNSLGRPSGTAHHKMYVSLRRDPKRDDIGLLCWNCNAAKHYYKQCPHKRDTNLTF